MTVQQVSAESRIRTVYQVQSGGKKHFLSYSAFSYLSDILCNLMVLSENAFCASLLFVVT